MTEVRPDAVVFADGAVRPSAVTDLDGRFRRAGAGRRERAAHRRAGPAAHRRDADQRRRRPHRRRRRRRRTVGPAAADELPGRRAAGRAGRQHRAEPHRRHRAGGARTRPSWGRASAWAGAAAMRQFARKDDTAGELLHRRPAGRVDQGGDLQGHAVGDPPRGPQARLHVRGSRAARARRSRPPLTEVVTES